MSNPHIEAMIDVAKSMDEYPYEMGGWGQPPDYGIDCRGFAQIPFKLTGVRFLVGGYQGNVRQMVAWAKANGRFREPANYAGKRGDLVFYNEPGAMPGPSGNPDCIRHVAILLRPVSLRWPKGRAMSAVNPKWDVRIHELLMHDLEIHKLAVYGFCAPDWASLDALEPAMVDPEPAI
jgi:hypothetical protein